MRHSLELALRSVLAEHSERPIYLVFPAFRISSRAEIDSSRGVSACVNRVNGIVIVGKLTRIDAMEVI